MSSTPRATVLVPTHNHGPTALRAVASALRQTVDDLEVFVVCDGVPDEHRWVTRELDSMDQRIRCFEQPKGPSHGELHRHAALAEARSEFVLYLADDDLWFDDHVETMLELLTESDFAHSLGVICEPNGSWGISTANLAHPFYRELLLNPGEHPKFQTPEERPSIQLPHIPIAAFGHRLDTYRRLPGWRTTPAGMFTDLYMWQQFLADDTVRLASGGWPTVLNFASADPTRGEASPDQRCEELDRWERILCDPEKVSALRREIANGIERESAWREAQIVAFERNYSEAEQRVSLLEEDLATMTHLYDSIRTSATWQLRARVSGWRGFRWFARPVQALARRLNS